MDILSVTDSQPERTNMDMLIERHPVVFYAAAMAVTVLLATLYVALSVSLISGTSRDAEFPRARASSDSMPSGLSAQALRTNG